MTAHESVLKDFWGIGSAMLLIGGPAVLAVFGAMSGMFWLWLFIPVAAYLGARGLRAALSWYGFGSRRRGGRRV